MLLYNMSTIVAPAADAQQRGNRGMPSELPMFPSPAHDHRVCLAAILSAAQQVCVRQGARLTAGRRRVLEVVADRHGAIGAYEIIDALAAGGRSRPAPMTVYRALDFLIGHGLVHRLASRNAYVACRHPGEVHAAQFLVCTACGTIGEIADDGLNAAVTAAAGHEDFAARAPLVEIEGVCARCRHAGRDPSSTETAPCR